MSQFAFKFFISGANPKHLHAVALLHHLCRTHLEGDYVLDVIDVVKEPKLAEAERILATPALVRISPAPEQRLIGDFATDPRFMRKLGFFPLPPMETAAGSTSCRLAASS